MRDVVVCTDASALLTGADAARLGIEVVPIEVALNGAAIPDDLDADAFYARLAAGARASTSQPNPADFAARFAAVASRGARAAISIHLDARVSGTADSAALAAREAPIPVAVVATETVSFGVAICARAAAEALAAGSSPEAAADRARALGVAVRNVFVAATAPGGRVSSSSGWTVATFENGATRPLAACANPTEAAETMAQRILEAGDPIRVAVGHAGAAVDEPAAELARLLAAAPAVAASERYRVGPPVGAHTGPLSFGAFWWPA